MKILYIIESLMSGGKERRLISLIKGLLKKKEVEIEIIILSENIHYKEIYDFNIKIHILKRNIKKDLKLLFKFNTILKTFRPDIVHCWDNVAAIHFGPICNIKKIPFINSMISTAPPANLVKPHSKRYLSTAISYPFSNIILANSKAGLDSFRVPQNKGRCIHNGFDFSRIKILTSKRQIRNSFNITTKYVVGMTGAFHDRKDYKSFVEAGEMVLKNRKDVTFVAIGAGPNLDKVKNGVSSIAIQNFRFVGKQNDVESIVNIFDIGVLTSNMKCHGEGISNSIMEYMAFEKPVIATNGGGTNELVIDGHSGYLIEEQNVIQLASHVEFLLNNSNIAKDMGKKGKQRIEKYFSIDNMVNEFLSLYSVMIKRNYK